ncbi:hypothetical protein QA612_22190 [Evansella sp. AB-P1]|uniref:hypothetical protein n=1 Tax=Evansella sp. AB-P1 TaxID=3037653 RepID=UPI00241CCC46|nr:hypothetical protein [Evansella sp. AB-P1]MDG5790153.1 hypothetical protein [Evansella sp. AB-P1]
MHNSKEFEIIFVGNVRKFEERLLYKAEQEMIKGFPAGWCQVADNYVRQLTIIQMNPHPEFNHDTNESHERPPSIKKLNQNIIYNNFYRWGIHGGMTGNHRIIYAIHNYHKVILLYYFDKKYNGSISRNDIIPAEVTYETYCLHDPNLY